MSKQANRGFVLVTSLIFLIVLSLFGVMALRGSLFEERISANDRDITLAREYAELALRDAERDISGLRFDGVTYCRNPLGAPVCTLARPAGTRPFSAADAGNFWVAANPAIDSIGLDNGGRGGADELRGMYSATASVACGRPVWSGANWGDGVNRTCTAAIATDVPTVAYGTFTDAPFPAAAGVPPPRYLIELFKAADLGIANSNKLFFRITAVGFGRTVGAAGGRTSVTLQSVYSPL
jgi:type IV pilus assembly protein PilX